MQKISVVLADEDKGTLDELAKSLPEDRFNVLGMAMDGTSLLNLIREKTPDVVVMEILLPQLDGFAVIEKIRQENIKTKIIVQSSLSMNGFINKAMSLGANYYVIKPFSASVLAEQIKDVCAKEEVDVNKLPLINAGHMEEKITNIFITVGIPAHIKGYQFLREAIKLAIANPEIINCITKKLYPTIAQKFSTTASKVERAIRHAIEVAWNRGKIENINNVFGLKVYSSNEKPTNGEFIALVADKMLIEGAL